MKVSSFSLGCCFSLFYLLSCESTNTTTSIVSESQITPEVKSVFIEGDSLHYIEKGEGDLVVFVHGSLGDYRTWGQQIDTFAEKYRVIAYSRRYAYPNQKTADSSADYTVGRHSKDLVAFLKTLGGGRAHLIGHSYGASTALSVAIEHPELVQSLTLGEPPVGSLLQDVPGGDEVLNNFVTQVIMPAAEAFKVNDSVRAVTIFINGVMGDSTFFSRLSERDLEFMMTNVLETRGTAFTRNPFTPVSCDDLKKLKVPVLLVKGEKSPPFFSLVVDELNRCLPNREIATIENVSHGLEYEDPVAFNRIVRSFLDKQ